ncbi:hypothetical protein AB0K81_25835 [Streptomyces werraensis]|uniref:SUKH-4 immunity protein of toxin-antitoxin system n=1 Tax=Streptomyces werraensis TaxID=68284 RepID=A0ABV3JMD0_9ACTN
MYDDPRHLDAPRDHDAEATVRRFTRLAEALEGRFGPSCRTGLFQDASVHGVVRVPTEATGFGRALWVELSNFGRFVTAGTGSGWDAPGAATDLPAEYVTWLDAVCAAAGCVFVPLDLLLEPYDGPSPTWADEDEALVRALEAAGEPVDDEDGEDRTPVWADRYFQWV